MNQKKEKIGNFIYTLNVHVSAKNPYAKFYHLLYFLSEKFIFARTKLYLKFIPLGTKFLIINHQNILKFYTHVYQKERKGGLQCCH